MTETVQPARPQPNPYLSQTADDKTWQLMSAAFSQPPEPLRAWLPRTSLEGSAEDRARGYEGEVRKKDDLLASSKATALLTSAVASGRTRSTVTVVRCSSGRVFVSRSAKAWQLNQLQAYS